MPGKPWEISRTPTSAEKRFEERLKNGTSANGWRDETTVPPLDVHADSNDPDREIRGEYLSRTLVDSPEEGGWWPFGQRDAQPPVIRVTDSIITGHVDLRAADLPYLLEFVRCRFDQAPDLRQANLAGLMLWQCRFPGVKARNLSTSNDTLLIGCTSFGGTITLADAQLGGSLELTDSRFVHPGRRTLDADRLSVAGALLAYRLHSAGEIRIPGARIAGNLNLSGAALRNRGQHAINATGIHIGGSIRAEVDPSTGRAFSVAGRIRLSSANIAGDLRLRDAVLEPGVSPIQRGESPHDDPVSTLIVDRAEIRGDVQLDQGFYSGGTLRLVSTKIGGDLRMSGARVDLSWARSSRAAVSRPLRALHLDGAEVLGNIEAPKIHMRGQLQLIDMWIRGSFQLTGATLLGPRTDVLQANRIQVGNNLDCREATISGTLQLQGAQVGANMDFRSTTLLKPAWHQHREAYKSSLDARAATVGRDLICAHGRHAFHAEGEVQLRRASIARQTNFGGCQLGEGSAKNALNAFGLVTQELTLLPAAAPSGRVVLRQAQCELLADNAELWSATGGVDSEDFHYDNFTHPVEPTDHESVRERLRWLRATSRGRYQPAPYDQLATVFRENGNEEHAVTVLIAKQQRRYQAIANESRLLFRLPVRLWSLLQRITVSYGYRPIRALFWLFLFAGAGTTWFSFHELQPINAEDRPVWNPFLYTVDQLVPIINLGHDVMWQAHGHSQWITVVLIAAGWTLATTVAAGITRSLRRER